MLGHYKAPARTSKVQESILINKAEQYAFKVKKSLLHRHEAWLYYTSCYLKSIGYVLGQTFFTKHTLENIDRPAIRVFTSTCGYNCNMAYTIRDSPSQYGGAEFTPLYLVQGIQQIENFLRYYCAALDTQTVLQNAIAWVQHQSGWHRLILQDTTTALPNVEVRWIPSIQKYLGENGMTLEMKYSGIYPCQWLNDRHIITTAKHSSTFTPLELRKLNYCRVYLGIMMLSSIT
eukprot:7473502-Ditylum_brightwellii.AAC.1